MSHTAFQNEVYRFLADYKHNHFPESMDGIWHNLFYEHIFSQQDAHLNFMLPSSSGTTIIPDKKGFKLQIPNHKTFSLHTDWTHLNSSQILCINYFFDFLFNTAKLTAFVNLLNIKTRPLSGEFEFNPGDGSSIDFVVHFENGSRLFCEIKYSESNFGGADVKKLGFDYYIRRKQELYGNIDMENEDFLKHYQIVRNVCLASNGNHTLFLYPSHNKSVSDDLSVGLKSIHNLSDFSIHCLNWEELLKVIPDYKVQEKYFPYM